jgi:hypothetical protein
MAAEDQHPVLTLGLRPLFLAALRFLITLEIDAGAGGSLSAEAEREGADPPLAPSHMARRR